MERYMLYKALGDRTRYRIMRALAKGEMCACDIPKVVRRAQPTVSLQLKYLARLGIVKSRRDGKLVLYRISDRDALRLIG